MQLPVTTAAIGEPEAGRPGNQRVAPFVEDLDGGLERVVRVGLQFAGRHVRLGLLVAIDRRLAIDDLAVGQHHCAVFEDVRAFGQRDRRVAAERRSVEGRTVGQHDLRIHAHVLARVACRSAAVFSRGAASTTVSISRQEAIALVAHVDEPLGVVTRGQRERDQASEANGAQGHAGLPNSTWLDRAQHWRTRAQLSSGCGSFGCEARTRGCVTERNAPRCEFAVACSVD